MNNFFRECDSFILEAASITTRDDSRVCLLDSIPQRAVKRPEDFTITDKDLVERPSHSKMVSIYHSKKAPLDHKGVPIIGFPEAAKKFFREKYLGEFPAELQSPEIYTGILTSNEPLYGTAHTLCTALPMSSDCIMLIYEHMAKPIATNSSWVKVVHEHFLNFVIFPIHLIPRVSINNSGYCFTKGEFNHDLACELNEVYKDAIMMENYLYLKEIEDQNEITRTKIEEAIKKRQL